MCNYIYFFTIAETGFSKNVIFITKIIIERIVAGIIIYENWQTVSSKVGGQIYGNYF